MDRVPFKGKQVLIADDYKPNTEMVAFAGRENELELIQAAWIWNSKSPPLSPLLVGEPGVGKNRIVYELHEQTGLPLYILQGHEDITAEDLACSVRFSDEDRAKMDYVLSPLSTAMLKGGICFIDEIGKIRPRALALLVSVLDERRYIDSTLLGDRIEAHKNFRFIAATNEGEEKRDLPEFIRSRLQPIIHVETNNEDIRIIVHSLLSGQFEQEKLIIKFWELWRDLESPTPRQAIQLFALASSFAGYELRPKSKDQRETPPSLKETHLSHAFDELFKK